jgi:hypothetical protein
MTEKTKIFIEKARKIHSDKYDYSKVEYVNNKTKVSITCPLHGDFWQTPKYHLDGCGCKMCYNEKRGKTHKLNTTTFIEAAIKKHNDKYSYKKCIYTAIHEKVCIICPKHGEFWQNANNHLRGQGCPLCANSKKGCYKKSNAREFVEKASIIHKNKYDYSKVNYINNYTKVCIICPEHGKFYQKPNDHLRGIGCNICGQKYKLTELQILKALREKYGEVKYQYTDTFLSTKTSPQQIDFFIPKYNIGVEYNGRQHFMPISKFGGEEEFELTKKRDIRKFKKCKENNIVIFYITFEKCDTSKYFTKVFTTLEELYIEIDNTIKNNIH